MPHAGSFRSPCPSGRCPAWSRKLLEHAYPLAAAGTVAEHAQLVVETVPVRVRCRTCKAETEAASNRLLCGSCNDWHVDVIAGEEMLLQRVEIETAEDPVH